MAMTGEHPPCRADTTNNLFLSAVDDVHLTPSVVNGNDARQPSPTSTTAPAPDRRRSPPPVQRIYANPASEFFFFQSQR